MLRVVLCVLLIVMLRSGVCFRVGLYVILFNSRFLFLFLLLLLVCCWFGYDCVLG